MRCRPGSRVREVVRAVALVIVALALTTPIDSQAGLLDDLKREVESTVKKKTEQKARQTVDCATDPAKCTDQQAATPAQADGSPVNPYASHNLYSHPAYQLANNLAAASTAEQVAELMRQAFDQINLGIYSHDGRRILGGAERKPTDLFLYDFHWKMLAKAFQQRNTMSFADHSAMLGAALLEMEDPTPLAGVLGKALERRYQQALRKPDEPSNYIVLLIDGLGRNQELPYSLEDAARFDDPRIRIDPLQSALIMLEFFSRAPGGKGKGKKASLDWLPALVPAAYADGPCDMIKGEDEQGYWGRGTDIVGEIGQELPGKTGKVMGVVGNVTGGLGAMGDLLTMYGMTIHLQPQPHTIHLHHPGEGLIAAIEATVSFDAQGVPDEVLKCGWLAGKQMPPNGGMKDVELTWDFSPDLTPQLQVHSSMFEGYGKKNPAGPTIVATSGGLRTLTDEQGVSLFLIDPTDCPHPEGGRMREKNYMASVNARYVTRSIPTPGLLGFGLILKLGPGMLEYLMHGRSAYARFAAQWHEKAPPPPVRRY